MYNARLFLNLKLGWGNHMRGLKTYFFFALLIFTCFGSLTAVAAAPHQMPPPMVQAEQVQIQSWQQKIQATGSLAARQGIVVKPEIAGRIVHIFFKSGQDVQQGAPLLQLNQGILKSQLALNQANLALRQREYKRAIELYQEHALAKADYDTAKANLASAQAQVDQAEAQLKQTDITAAFSGKLGLRQVSVGDFVTAGQTIVNLQSLDPIVVNFSVPENYLNKLAIGDTVQVHSDAFSKKVFTGKVYAYDSVVDPDTRTLAVRASVPNPDEKLLPGSFVEVALLLGSPENLIAVPQTALMSSLSGTYVYKVVNGKAVQTPVVVGKLENAMATIKRGLAIGDVVVTDGQIKIQKNNSPIVVAPVSASAN